MKFIFLVSLYLVGCSTVPLKKEVDLGGGVYLRLPPPREISAPIKAVQIITFKWQGRSRSTEAVFRNLNNLLEISVLNSFWPTPIKASYNGEELQVDRQLKKVIPFDFRYILTDIVLVYASQTHLAQWLGGGARVEQVGLVRNIYAGDKKIFVVTYSKNDLWQSEAHLKNLQRNYEIIIQTIKTDKL